MIPPSILDTYSTFLFDFDGLLVNTELKHYHAYKEALKRRNLQLEWDFKTYCSFAHSSTPGLANAVCSVFPELDPLEWHTIRAEKILIYEEIIENEVVDLMPGVSNLLRFLEEKNYKRAIVTNSPRDHLEKINRAHPILQSIPHLITRESYRRPKPFSDPYEAAKKLLHVKHAIAFEDTTKGIESAKNANLATALVGCMHPTSSVTPDFTLNSLEDINYENTRCVLDAKNREPFAVTRDQI